MLNLIDTVYLSGHWLSPIINGDYSGLESGEDKELDDYLEFIELSGKAPFTFDVRSEEPSFVKDEISGLMADCYIVNIYGCHESDMPFKNNL